MAREISPNSAAKLKQILQGPQFAPARPKHGMQPGFFWTVVEVGEYLGLGLYSGMVMNYEASTGTWHDAGTAAVYVIDANDKCLSETGRYPAFCTGDIDNDGDIRPVFVVPSMPSCPPEPTSSGGPATCEFTGTKNVFTACVDGHPQFEEWVFRDGKLFDDCPEA